MPVMMMRTKELMAAVIAPVAVAVDWTLKKKKVFVFPFKDISVLIFLISVLRRAKEKKARKAIQRKKNNDRKSAKK